jgi:hypothetical protein
MKKILFLFITGLTVSASYSQDISDAVRYSQDNLSGTSRFRAMNGAFGAVGGDLSSISVNPAGSAIFSNNQVGVSFNNQSVKNNSDYFGTKTSESANSFTLNQAGGVFVFHDRNPNNNWKKIAIAAAYETTNNFKNDVFSAGTNPTRSIDRYFLAYANRSITSPSYIDNTYFEDLSYIDQQTQLGLDGKVILASNNKTYSSNVPVANDPNKNNYYQENESYTRGYNSKLSFNIGTSYKDRLYLGANLNVHVTDYTRSSSFYEENLNPLTATETISDLRFNNDLRTYGNGFSFQLGAIAKVTESFRVGLAYESNTWYELYDETTQSLYTTTDALDGSSTQNNINPNVTMIYDPYTLQTPGKVTFSGAYVFGKSGLISIDYAIKDYGNTKFKNTGYEDNRILNNNINDQLTSNGELRIGGEYKIKQLSLRGGYRFEGSPYKNGTTIGDLTSYSGGLGYNFGSTKLDLAYSCAERESNQGFFSQGFTDGANIKSKLNTVSLTLLFEL